jgi:hypothetical protein
MVHSVQEDAMADMQTMVGASKDERALSSPFFAVKKRLPWLQINLLTAFIAAALLVCLKVRLQSSRRWLCCCQSLPVNQVTQVHRRLR